MSQPLHGRTVALAETRQLEELALLLEKEGATVLRCPLVAIKDAPDETPVMAWLNELIAGRFAYVVLMTGEALRRLLGFADRASRRHETITALAKLKLVTRGPKPVQALKEIGLQPQLVAQPPTTEGVMDALKAEPLVGKVVGYTLFGSPNPILEAFLTEAGAVGRPVLAYVYSAASDADRVADLIARMIRGEVDLLIITSSPQIERLVEVARERGCEMQLLEALGRTTIKVAAIGPVAAASLQKHGMRVDIQPPQGFVMKNLVQYVKRAFDGAGYIHGTDPAEQTRLAKLGDITTAAFIQFLEFQKDSVILDVGCGLGILTRKLAGLAPDGAVWGVERSADQLAKAVCDSPNLHFQQADAQDMPFEDNTFDVVFCRYLLEHVADPLLVLREMRRVLKPRGKAFVQENNIFATTFDPDCPHFDALWRQSPRCRTCSAAML